MKVRLESIDTPERQYFMVNLPKMRQETLGTVGRAVGDEQLASSWGQPQWGAGQAAVGGSSWRQQLEAAVGDNHKAIGYLTQFDTADFSIFLQGRYANHADAKILQTLQLVLTCSFSTFAYKKRSLAFDLL